MLLSAPFSAEASPPPGGHVGPALCSSWADTTPVWNRYRATGCYFRGFI